MIQPSQMRTGNAASIEQAFYRNPMELSILTVLIRGILEQRRRDTRRKHSWSKHATPTK